MTAGFGARLAAAVDALGPLCVGIDPHGPLLRAWGLADDPDGLARFADACVAAFAGHVAVVKPQSAFFERHGSRGIAVLERLLVAFGGTCDARAAGRQAGRHRLDHAGLRRRLSRRGRARWPPTR